ncbi:MAG: MCE family protein [Marmoricola sp.]
MTRARKLRAVRWVAVVLCAAFALTGCSVYDVPLPGGADTGDHPMTVHAEFRDVLDLVPQSTVKVDDISVGRITGITLKGYTADVTMQLPGDVNLPSNAVATIRQTSLLGEKFVSLAAPDNPTTERLANGDTIGLDDTGRNPEVEEVLSALGALLSGGGVAQLKTIAEELNTTVGGREQDIRSVLDQLHFFMGQLDRNKQAVVDALDNLNGLAGTLRQQDRTIKLALDNIPGALRSINRQRDDLVKVLHALSKLSDVGTRVIAASKETTISTLRDLSPVLFQLAAAGDAFPKSLQVFLTYPFVDEAVGRDPQVARNLHIGDYTDLNLRLDLELANLTLPGLPNVTLGDVLQICGTTPLAPICKQAQPLVDTLCGSLLKSTPLCTTPGTGGGSGGGGGLLGGGGTGGGNNPLGGLLGGLGGGTKTGTKSGASSGGGSGGAQSGSGSGLGGLLGGLGLGRVNPGPAFRTDAGRPAWLRFPAGSALETGVGTLLFQGALS